MSSGPDWRDVIRDALQRAEDTAHVSGDTGLMPLAVRNDVIAALAGADGDYAPLQVDAEGKLWVSASVGSGAGDYGKVEDAAHASGDVGVMQLAVRNDTLGALAGTDGDYAPFQVDADGGLYLAPISAGTNNIGKVSSDGITITQNPTITAGAYAAGDNVGELLTFASAAQVSGGGGVIKNVLIIDDAGQDAELELWLFDTTFTAGSDNDAWAPTEAQLHTLIAVISTQDSDQGWVACGTPSICDIEMARRYDCTGTSLFGRLVTRAASTYVATDDVTVRIMLLQD